MLVKMFKAWLNTFFLTLSIVAIAQGGWWLWAPVVTLMVVMILGDWLLPKDLSPPITSRSWLFNLPVYSGLPLLIVLNGLFLWMFGNHDGGEAAKWLQAHTGFDLLAAREATTSGIHWLGGVLSLAFLNALTGTIGGHELTHRTSRPFDMFIGRWMLTTTADTSFAIEHVYGHHARVCTLDDPATARRGESYYAFAWRSTIHSYLHAFQIEKARLQKLGKSVWNPFASPFLRGNLQNLVPAAAAFGIAGWPGLLVWIAIALIGKELLEAQNYFAHYGLVREPGKPVQPRHSWNSSHWLSTNMMYSLARHSHHHAEADAPYWTLDASVDAPELPAGYMTMILAALVPPLFKQLMTPALNEWDRKWASEAERELARQASLNSGMDGLSVCAGQASRSTVSI